MSPWQGVWPQSAPVSIRQQEWGRLSQLNHREVSTLASQPRAAGLPGLPGHLCARRLPEHRVCLDCFCGLRKPSWWRTSFQKTDAQWVGTHPLPRGVEGSKQLKCAGHRAQVRVHVWGEPPPTCSATALGPGPTSFLPLLYPFPGLLL